MPDRALPTLLPWQVEVLNRLWVGEQFVISVPRMNGRTSLRRWVQSWDDVNALVFLNYLKVWDAPGGRELEPPRRPPSWYPGQPEPQKPRRRACTCFYGLRQVLDAPGPYAYSPPPSGEGDLTWWTRCFVIVFDCPHHGDDRYEEELALDEQYPDGGVWGFTLDDC